MRRAPARGEGSGWYGHARAGRGRPPSPRYPPVVAATRSLRADTVMSHRAGSVPPQRSVRLMPSWRWATLGERSHFARRGTVGGRLQRRKIFGIAALSSRYAVRAAGTVLQMDVIIGSIFTARWKGSSGRHGVPRAALRDRTCPACWSSTGHCQHRERPDPRSTPRRRISGGRRAMPT